MRHALHFLALAVATSSATAQSGPCTGELATIAPYAATGSGPVGGAVYFDLDVIRLGGVRMEQIELNIAGAAGISFNLNVYAHVGTSVGNESSNNGWFLTTAGSGISAGVNQPTIVDFPDVTVPSGQFGIALVLFGAAHAYTAGNGANQAYSSNDLALTLGSASTGMFGGTLSSPVVWNGKLIHNCPPPIPTSYCTAGLSTNFCTPYITGSQEPSASLATPCFVNVYFVEGQKLGLIFYGVNNSGFTPVSWGASSSYMCVKAPVQRTGVQDSGGDPDTCDGILSLSWNAYQLANPGALGQPFSAGDKVYAQAWYRDPASPKTTNLSNALEMTMQP